MTCLTAYALSTPSFEMADSSSVFHPSSHTPCRSRRQCLQLSTHEPRPSPPDQDVSLGFARLKRIRPRLGTAAAWSCMSRAVPESEVIPSQPRHGQSPQCACAPEPHRHVPRPHSKRAEEPYMSELITSARAMTVDHQERPATPMLALDNGIDDWLSSPPEHRCA